MRKVLVAISLLAGVIIGSQGIDVLTTSVRGEAIYRMGILIPAQDSTLNIYGSIFLVIGIALIAVPIVLFIKRKQTVS